MLSSIFAENEILKVRTNARLASTKARGRVGGRPNEFIDAAKAKSAASFNRANRLTTDEICKVLVVPFTHITQ